MIKFDQQHRIVWIASYPRSGKAWVTTFLFALYNVFRDPDYAAVDLVKSAGFSAWDNSLDLYRKHLSGPLQLTSRRQMAEARPKVMQDILRANKGAVLLKTHNSRVEDFTPFIDDRLTAGAIYLIRNPLDVAISLAAFRGISVDEAIADMARKDLLQMPNPSMVYSMIGSWTGNVRSWLDRKDEDTLFVRYEDLVGNPGETLASVAAHMLMRPTPEQLEKAVALSAFERLRAIEDAAGKGNVTSAPAFFRAGTAGEWRSALQPHQVDRVVAAHGKLMEQFGYLP
jgi:hypothetical protein